MARAKKTLEPVGNQFAYQHNNLIRTPLKMGLIESRIFLQALSHLNRETTDFPTSIIPVTAVMRELTNGEAYEDIKRACDTLVYRVLDLVPAHESKGRFHKVPLMSEVDFVKGEATLRVRFNEKAKPYLLELKEAGCFTSADVTTLLSFKNPNTARLYWILKSWQNLGSGPMAVHEQEIEELKWWLLEQEGLYPIFNDFRRRVLDPIAEEFKAVGYGATWEPVRTGKKITGVKFSIPRETKGAAKLAARQLQLDIPTKESPKTVASPVDRVLALLGGKYEQADWQVSILKTYLTVGAPDQLKDRQANVKTLLSSLDKRKAVGNYGAYVWTSLVDAFPFLKRLHDEYGS